MEVDYYLESADHGNRFGYDDFVRVVAEGENMNPENDDDLSDAAYHAQAIVALVADVVPESERQQVRDQLPADEDWGELFELVGRDEAFDQQGQQDQQSSRNRNQ